jgi:vacuolar-type H+-ATPase subunit F/Vma7
MRLLVAGQAREIQGFALAGVEVVACDTPTEAHAVVDGLGTDVGLLIVSQWFGRAAGERLARIRERNGPPVVLVLPGDLQNAVEHR